METHPYPANKLLLEDLKERAVPRQPSNTSPFDLDGYELHTHPDLVERLYALAKSLPPSCRGAIYGYPVLAVNEVIFAVATGTHLLAMRLPENMRKMAEEYTGKPYPKWGPDWYTFGPWSPEPYEGYPFARADISNPSIRSHQYTQDLRYWLEVAYQYVLERTNDTDSVC